MGRAHGGSTSRSRWQLRANPEGPPQGGWSGRGRGGGARKWLVEDRWWTPTPLRRHYFELALARRAGAR